MGFKSIVEWLKSIGKCRHDWMEIPTSGSYAYTIRRRSYQLRLKKCLKCNKIETERIER
jgi:hypothetical protein